MKYIYHITRAGTRKEIGNKAASLYKMLKSGFNVPDTYVLPQHTRSAFLSDPGKAREQLLREIHNIPDKNRAWAIRSSGALEDLREHSFAGQYTSLLDVQGDKSMLEGIEDMVRACEAKLSRLSYKYSRRSFSSNSSPNSSPLAYVFSSINFDPL